MESPSNHVDEYDLEEEKVDSNLNFVNFPKLKHLGVKTVSNRIRKLTI